MPSFFFEEDDHNVIGTREKTREQSPTNIGEETNGEANPDTCEETPKPFLGADAPNLPGSPVKAPGRYQRIRNTHKCTQDYVLTLA